MTSKSTLGRPMALVAVFMERYGISLVFFFLAVNRGRQLLALVHSGHSGTESAPVVEVIRELIWVQLYLYSGLLLLIGRRVKTPPQNLRDILLPVGTTFFYLAYSTVQWFPACLKQSVFPANWQSSCMAIGLVLNLIGLWIAIWAAVYLGRSFGVLIEVRKVVFEGAYKWVRHPMYSGYLFFLTGFALTNSALAFFILIPMHIALLLYRARLEEERLSTSSPEYAEYRKRTGFIFPKLSRPG